MLLLKNNLCLSSFYRFIVWFVLASFFLFANAVTAATVVFEDNFDGVELDAAKWRQVRYGGALNVSVATGLAHFPQYLTADTCGKFAFTGDAGIVLEGRFAGQGTSRDSYFKLVGADETSVIQVGDSNYWAGYYINGSGALAFPTASINGSIKSFKEYRISINGSSLTFARGDSLSALTETKTITLPYSIVGKTFFFRIGTGSYAYSPADFDWVRVTAAPGTLQANCSNVGVVTPPTNVTAVTPTAARLDVAQDFTVTGTNLSANLAFTIEDCEPESGPGGIIPEVGTGTATQRKFRCIPRLPGSKNVTVKIASGGVNLFTSVAPATTGAIPITIDHPARLGSPSARGIPAVQGVSLWNGNVHLQATDLTVPGKGVSFALTRSYNSYSWAYEDNRGGVSQAAPWRFNWDLKLGYVGAGSSAVNTRQIWVEREDGSGENFYKDTDNLWYPVDQGNFNQIKGDTPVAGQTTLLTREGLKYIFQNPNLGGLLIKIIDHDGNGLTIARDASNRVGTVREVSDPTNRFYTFAYDSNNRLTTVTDFTGRYVQYGWDGTSTRLKTVRDVRGGITTYNYSVQTPTTTINPPPAQTLLTGIIDPNGSATTAYSARTFTYTDTVYGNWGAKTVTDGEGNTWRFNYCAKLANGTCQADPTAAQGFETTVTPPLGSAKITRFDTAGRLTERVVQANASAAPKTSKTTPFDITGIPSKFYNQAALTTKQESALGLAGGFGTSYSYTSDNAGNLVSQSVPVLAGVNAVTTRAWNTDAHAAARLANNLHRVTQFTDAQGNATASTFNASGNLLTHKPPGLVASALTYTGGLLTSVKDALNQTTDRGYDIHGNLLTVIDPLIAGASTRLFVANTYYPNGQVQTSTDKRGLVTTYVWDAAGNLASSQNTVGGVVNLVSHQYDANGNRSQSTDAMGNVTKYSYDKNNRLKTVEKLIAGGSIVTRTNYDALGRVTSTVNGNNHASSTTLDDIGNVLTRANALPTPSVTRYTYDDDNRVTQTQDPEGRITQTTYDRVGHVKTVTTGVGTAAALTTSYDYDLNGRMVKMTDPRGNSTQYGYDGAGRLTTLTDAAGGITRATYDDNGNLRTVQDPNLKTTTYTYDEVNRPLTRVDANGQTWKTVYDANGNIVAQSVPGNTPAVFKVTNFSYDLLNRLTNVTYPDNNVVSYSYDKNGNRKTMTDSSGTTSYSYDALNRLSSKTDTLTGKTVGYSYDGVGNVKTLTYPGNQVVSYNYDEAERLNSLTDWLGKTTSYTLNRAGQVTAALFGNGSTVERVFDGSGRQTSLINKQPGGTVISSHGLTLDGNGNITNSAVQLPLPPSLPNVNRAFTYDAANRLATVNGAAVTHDLAGRISSLGGDNFSYNDRDQVTAIAGAHSASYSYNGAGHRVQRTLSGQTMRFVIDANRSLPEVLAETDGAGNVLRNYVYGYGLVSQIDAANSSHYYHFDPTGSTLALTDATGVVTDAYAYTPYGETTASGSTVNPFRYVGKLGVMDDGNGLHFMRARYYRADVGRFLSLDALAGSPNKPQTLNRYAYAGGNPVMGVDPSGLAGQLTEEAMRHQKAQALREKSKQYSDYLSAQNRSQKNGATFLELSVTDAIGHFGTVVGTHITMLQHELSVPVKGIESLKPSQSLSTSMAWLNIADKGLFVIGEGIDWIDFINKHKDMSAEQKTNFNIARGVLSPIRFFTGFGIGFVKLVNYPLNTIEKYGNESLGFKFFDNTPNRNAIIIVENTVNGEYLGYGIDYFQYTHSEEGSSALYDALPGLLDWYYK